VRRSYDHIGLPLIRSVFTQVRVFDRRCSNCRRRVRGTPPETMPPGLPFSPPVLATLAYLHIGMRPFTTGFPADG
jgi:hypothetical protein